MRADDTQAGDASELIQATDLLQSPMPDSPVVGRLPKGTILSLQGEKQGKYVSVSVELTDGNAEGWVDEEALKKKTEDKATPPPKSKSTYLNPKHRIRIPREESILLYREPTFFYGLKLAPHYGIISAATTNPQLPTANFVGLGVSAGGDFGIFLDRDITLRLEVNYMQLNGTASDETSANFGFMDTALLGELRIDRFRIFTGLSYAYGLNLGNLSQDIASEITQASDVSSMWFHVGTGYRAPLTDVIGLNIRLEYGVSFNRSPVGFQTIGLSFGLEFQG